MKRLIAQKHGFGCGFACMASLLGVSYEQALLLVDDGKKRAKKCGLYCLDIVQVLKTKGYQDAYSIYLKPNKKRLINRSGVIVYIKKTKRYPAGHYLLRYKDKWMDPWINFVPGADAREAKAGFRKRLPGMPIYGVFSKNIG